MIQIEREFDDPYEELPECEERCPYCNTLLDWGDLVFCRDGDVIGCEMCIGRTEAHEFFRPQAREVFYER